MPFVKGMKKIEGAGRKAGTPNRLNAARDTLAELGIDPLRELAKFLGSDDENIAFSASKELCKYVYPTLKSVEVKATDDPFKDLSDEEKLEKARTVVALLEERVKK